MNCGGMLDFVRQRLPAPGEKSRLQEIADGARVPFHTLLKIAKGETADPRISTVQNLYDYLREMPRERRQRKAA